MIERNFILAQWETFWEDWVELTLKKLEKKIIEADNFDETLPEWEWLFMDFLIKNEALKHKKTFQLCVLSEPYQSILEHKWKLYTIQIKKVKEYTLKIKLYINNEK